MSKLLPSITVVNITASNRGEVDPPWLSFNEPPTDIYCGRSMRSDVPLKAGERGWLGNPFGAKTDKTGEGLTGHGPKARERNILAFRRYFERRCKWDADFALALSDLADLALAHGAIRLGCFCAPQKCHADVIAAHLLILCSERIHDLLSKPPSPDEPAWVVALRASIKEQARAQANSSSEAPPSP